MQFAQLIKTVRHFLEFQFWYLIVAIQNARRFAWRSTCKYALMIIQSLDRLFFFSTSLVIIDFYTVLMVLHVFSFVSLYWQRFIEKLVDQLFKIMCAVELKENSFENEVTSLAAFFQMANARGIFGRKKSMCGKPFEPKSNFNYNSGPHTNYEGHWGVMARQVVLFEMKLNGRERFSSKPDSRRKMQFQCAVPCLFWCRSWQGKEGECFAPHLACLLVKKRASQVTLISIMRLQMHKVSSKMRWKNWKIGLTQFENLVKKWSFLLFLFLRVFNDNS